MNEKDLNSSIANRSILDYTTLNVTVKELAAKRETELVAQVERIIRENKVADPESSSPALTTSYYQVDLPIEDLDKITDLFFELEEEYGAKEGEKSATALFYARLADKWSNVVPEDE